MEIAPEIIFHDVDRTGWVEAYIVERLGRPSARSRAR
jgi:hypothetical protein